MYTRGSYEWALFQTLDPKSWGEGWENNFGDFHRQLYPPTLVAPAESVASAFVFENPPARLFLSSLLALDEDSPSFGCNIARPLYARNWWEQDCVCRYTALTMVLKLRLVCRHWNSYILSYLAQYLDLLFTRTNTYLPLYRPVSTTKHQFRYYRILENLWRLSTR